jgi:integrase
MSVRKLRNSWWVDFRHDHTRYRLKSPENSRAGAHAYEALLRQRTARGEPVAQTRASRVRFDEFAAQWMTTYVAANNKPTEQRAKRIALARHLLPAFGHLSLEDVTARRVEEYKASRLATGLRAKTVNNQLAILSRLLGSAVEWGALETAPRVRLLKAPIPVFSVLTEHQAEDLMAATDPEWRDMVLLALRTGMRVGELCALRWEDVDLARGQIAVRRSIAQGIESTTKSNRVRHVPLADDVVDALRSRRHTEALLFPAKHGGHLRHCVADRALKRQCARAGVRAIGWHALRHTFATLLAAKGVPLHVVQQLLGHATIHMTLRYAHVLPSSFEAALKVLNEGARTVVAGGSANLGLSAGNASCPVGAPVPDGRIRLR